LPPVPSLRLSDTHVEDYEHIWKTQSAVRMTVDFLARNIAQLGLHVYRRKGDSDRERLTKHPLAALIQRPNGQMTRYRFLDKLMHDMGIFDQSYWIKVRDPKSGAVIGLLHQPPQWVIPRGRARMTPEEFEISDTDGRKVYPAADVLFFRGYNPFSDVGGISPIEGLRDTLLEAYAATKQRDQLLRNAARMSGYIERPLGAEWSVDTRDRFRAQWQAQYAGDGPSAGGTPILEDGMSFKANSQSSKELQYV